MPGDGLTDKPSNLAINNTNNNDDTPDTTNAIPRLRQEAKQNMSAYTPRRKDVTNEFRNAAELLPPGQLVKDEFFTLFESVGALEIMDPKMDSGYVPPDDTFEPDFDPCSTLDAVQVLWVMDQLLCLEITWLESYPLSQTIYTSLHIDRLLSPDKEQTETFHFGSQTPTNLSEQDRLVHKVLCAYCIGLVKCCQLILHLIQSQNFYEEEDFVTHLFGRELLPGVGSIAAKNRLADAISWISDSSLSNDVQQALITRCRFRLALIQTLSDEGRRWDDIAGYLTTIKDSHALAEAVPDAFSEKVQRQLATSTPPRPMIQISFESACSKWNALVEDMNAAYRFTSSDIIRNPNYLKRATWAFAYRGQPSTLARAQMQSILFDDQAVAGQVYHFDLLLIDISDLVLAGDPLVDPESFNIEVPSDSRHICSKLMTGFMEKAIEEYLNLYRMVCQNRCRIRRTFTQAIPVLDALEQEAENVDAELEKHSASLRVKLKHPQFGHAEKLNPLQTWCFFHVLRNLIWTVQLGFETDIYLPDELSRMYRFLSILCIYLDKHIDHILRFTLERKRSTRDAKRSAACSASLDFLRSLMDSAQTTQSLADALFKFYLLLIRMGVITAPKRDFAERTLLYEARMKPFLCVRGWTVPTLASFEDDEDEQNAMSFEAVLASINDDIKDAKAVLGQLKKYTPEQGKYVGTEDEWRKEIKQMETTGVAIAVAASQLKRIREKYGTDYLGEMVECKLEKKYHEWWVVPQLKEKVKT